MQSQTFFDILTNPTIAIPIGFAYIILVITGNNVLNSKVSRPDKKISLIIYAITSIILISVGISWLKQPKLSYNCNSDIIQFKTIENKHYQQNNYMPN